MSEQRREADGSAFVVGKRAESREAQQGQTERDEVVEIFRLRGSCK